MVNIDFGIIRKKIKEENDSYIEYEGIKRRRRRFDDINDRR